jgi:hypothetical protein
MNSSPFGADCFELRRNHCADLRDLDQAKPRLVNKPRRAIWAIQLKFRTSTTPPDSMNMRGRMVVGIDRNANVSDRQDGWHAAG